MTPKGLVMANYDTLYVFDDDWQVVDSLSHPLFVGIHEIDWDGEHLWAAATAIDAVLRVGLDWTVEAAWDPHGRAGFERFGLRPRPHPLDGTIDYRVRQAPVLNECHVNGVARWNGTTVINCGLVRRRKPLHQRLVRRTAQKLGIKSRDRDRHRSARSLVVRLDPDRRSHVLVELDEHDFPTHNGQLLDENRVAVNDSTAQHATSLRAAEMPTRERSSQSRFPAHGFEASSRSRPHGSSSAARPPRWLSSTSTRKPSKQASSSPTTRTKPFTG